MSNKKKSKQLYIFVVQTHTIHVGNNIDGPNYTFTTKQTMLDYVVFGESLYKNIKSYEILAEVTFSNTSDHLPISVDILVESNFHRIGNVCSKLHAWH